MLKVSDTLNYVKQVTNGLHSPGYIYKVYMSDFFYYDTPTGQVQHGPPPKRKKAAPAAATQSLPPPEEQLEDQPAEVFKVTHEPIEQSKYNYDCYNVDISLTVYDTFTHAAQAPPKHMLLWTEVPWAH